jgi:hypothetical protein
MWEWLAQPQAAVTVDTVATLVLLATLTIVARQIWLQRQDLEFRIYQQINDRYSDLLWRAVEDPDLDLVWIDLSQQQREWLSRHGNQTAQVDSTQSHGWSTWYALNRSGIDADDPPPFDLVVEKKLYRFTRAALELIEEAHFAQSKRSIQPDTWQKFGAVLDTWSHSRYFAEVFRESAPRLTNAFTCDARERLPHMDI